MAADVRRQVVRRGVGEVVEEAGADQRAEGRLAELDRALDEVDGGDPVLAVRAHVVADDERAVRPADEHRPIEAQLVDDRRDVVGPEAAVGVVLRFGRRLRHAVAAQVAGDEPELLGERLSYCFAQHRWFCDQPWMNTIGGAVRRAPLADVQPQPAAAVTVWICIACSCGDLPS